MKKNKQDISMKAFDEVNLEEVMEIKTEEEEEIKKGLTTIKKTIIILTIAIIVTLLLLIMYFNLAKYDVSNNLYNAVIYNNQIRPAAYVPLKMIFGLKMYTPVLTEIHKMSHNVIIANEIWGRLPLTEKRVNRLIIQIQGSSWSKERKEGLLDILYKWKDGDFNHAHLDHNFVWRKLGGNIGEAMGVDYGKIPRWAKEKFNYQPVIDLED